MQKISNLLGLPVIITGTGAQIGEVEEVIVDLEQACVCGIILRGANWFTADQGIIFEDLFRVGRDAVMVRASYVVRDLATALLPGRIYHMSDIVKKQVFTEAGFSLGAVVDIIYDGTTGEIKTYELSDGLITDLLYGRRMMPLPQAQVVGQNTLIVPETMTNLLHADNQEV